MRKVSSFADVQVVLNQLLNWQSLWDSKARDQKGLQIKNGGVGTDDSDFVVLSQLKDLSQTLGNQFPNQNQSSGSQTQNRLYWRTLTLTDLTVGNNIALNTTVQASGVGKRVAAVLRSQVTANLLVDIYKTISQTNLATTLVAHVTIPSSTQALTELEVSIPGLQFLDKQVLIANIVSSDGSKDPNGIAEITVEWIGA